MARAPRKRQLRRMRRRRAPAKADGGIPATAQVFRLPGVGADTHTFVRRVAPSGVTKAAAGDYYALWSFTLDQVPGYTDFTALYDQYHIKQVKVTFSLYGGTAGTMWNPLIASDYDGGTPSSFNAVCERRTKQFFLTPTQPAFTLTFKPKVAMSVYSTGGTVASGVGSPWLDMASTSIVHYGFWMAIAGYNASTSSTINWSAEVVLVCRGLR